MQNALRTRQRWCCREKSSDVAGGPEREKTMATASAGVHRVRFWNR